MSTNDFAPGAAAPQPGTQQVPPRPEPQGAASAPPPNYFQADSRLKSPGLAAFLSIMPGLGQVYVGYYQQGFFHIVIVASTIALLSRGIGSLEPLFGMMLAFFWLFNMIDAARRASFYNQAMARGGQIESLEGFRLPNQRGGLLGGVIMIVIGLLALMNIHFHLTFYWLERWWPITLVLFGAYLIYRSARAGKMP